jgi:hypothetical protein
VPAVPLSLLVPVWVEFSAMIGEDRAGFDPGHPLGCHRHPIPPRVVFEHLIEALAHGSGYERIATAACSDRTIRRRLKLWAQAGVAQWIHEIALAAYDRIISLELDDLSVDGCIAKAPCGGDKAGPSPVDRRKSGLKRYRGFTGVHPSGLPLACGPRVEQGLLGFSPRLRTPPSPATHARVGTGHGHWPGTTQPTRPSVEPPSYESTHCVRPRVAPRIRCCPALRRGSRGGGPGRPVHGLGRR